MGALPQGYKVPESASGYFKFQEGKNRFRILSNIITGYEVWLDEDGKRKPYRSKSMNDLPVGEEQPRHFWAMVVVNRDLNNKIQVLEITQRTIQNALFELNNNDDWGELTGYDINVTKTKEGQRTTYSVMPSPKKDVEPEVMDKYLETEINLNALYKGEDPFATYREKQAAANAIDPKDLPF